MRRPAFARLKVVFPVYGRSDVKGNIDGLVEVVDNGEVVHVFWMINSLTLKT